ncbi:MAG TPA: ImmA/IrrE family metallo-endopeptidase [Gallionellaceae bacterium]
MPYDAAQEILNEIWKERGLPVDPVWIAGQLGMRVVEMDLPDEVSGALIKETGKDPLIALSSSDSKNRKRFTCAHEIGHYINRKRNNNENYEYVDLRSAMSSKGQDPEEIYANRFAAQLLMPHAIVKELHEQGLHSIGMASRFGVSDEAMNHRLYSLKLK